MKPLQNNEKRPTASPSKDAQNATHRKRRRRHPIIRFMRHMYRFLIRALRIPPIHLDGFLIGKGLVCCGLILLLALLQTTLLARFRPFGAIPDLMLSAVIAIAMLEGEKWGCLIGLFAAFVIESLGGSEIQLLPLLYMPVGYFAPVVTELYFTDSAPVRFMYSVGAGFARALLTMMLLAMTLKDFSLPGLFVSVALPEYASTLLLSVPVQILIRTVLHPFHKSRSERVGTI